MMIMFFNTLLLNGIDIETVGLKKSMYENGVLNHEQFFLQKTDCFYCWYRKM